jgi:hypothetical protein
MNAIVGRIEPVKTVKKPRDVAIGELRGQLRQAKAEIRALKRQVKEERAHAADMLAWMRRMAVRQWGPDVLLGPRPCRCTPTRAEMMRRR